MSEDVRKMIDNIKNVTNHSERYNLLLKKYYSYKEQDMRIDTKFNDTLNNVLFFDIPNFLTKFNFSKVKDYNYDVKYNHNFVENYVSGNVNNILEGDLFPSSTYPANDCMSFEVKNISLKNNKLFGNVIFNNNELGKLSYYIIKNKLMNANFQIKGEFENFTKLININGFMIK